LQIINAALKKGISDLVQRKKEDLASDALQLELLESKTWCAAAEYS